MVRLRVRKIKFRHKCIVCDKVAVFSHQLITAPEPDWSILWPFYCRSDEQRLRDQRRPRAPHCNQPLDRHGARHEHRSKQSLLHLQLHRAVARHRQRLLLLAGGPPPRLPSHQTRSQTEKAKSNQAFEHAGSIVWRFTPGDCDMAVCGGVSCIVEPRVFVALSKARMISPDGTSKPFSTRADGYGRGEGCGVLLLKPLKTV